MQRNGAKGYIFVALTKNIARWQQPGKVITKVMTIEEAISQLEEIYEASKEWHANEILDRDVTGERVAAAAVEALTIAIPILKEHAKKNKVMLTSGTGYGSREHE